MSLNLKSEKRKVLSTGHIDGGAYRAVETPDGGAMVEEWKGGKWVPGGAGYGEVREAPPVSAQFAARLGIPIEDLQEATDRTCTSAKLHLVMIDPPGPFSALEEWKRHLTELEALPLNTLNRDQLIDEAKRTIARKRQEVEKPSEVPFTDTALLSADCNKKAGGFKADYGLRLLNDGYSPTTDLYFYEFRLFSISVLGKGDYSTMVEQRYDGEWHALSLDFNRAQLEQILVGADPTLAAFIRAELKNPFPRTIELDGYVSFAVRARLGPLQTGANEQFSR
jgi:hypothetical protein